MLVRKQVPPLVRVVTYSSNLTISNLSDTTHPINQKSISGKDIGAGIWVEGRIFIATGSTPSHKWDMLSVEEAITFEKGIYTDTSVNSTNASGSMSTFNALGSTSLTPLHSSLSGSFTIAPNNQFGLVYSGESISVSIHAQGICYKTGDASIAGKSLCAYIINGTTAEVALGSHDFSGFLSTSSTVYDVSFNCLGYLNINDGDLIRASVSTDYSGTIHNTDMAISIDKL